MLSRRRLALAAVAVLASWIAAFRSSDDEAGLFGGWGTRTRGHTVALHDQLVETREELAERDRIGPGHELRENLGDLKRSVLGDRRKTRGERIGRAPVYLPPGYAEATPREACNQMKLSDPQRYGSLDCSADEYDSPLPWSEAPRGGGSD